MQDPMKIADPMKVANVDADIYIWDGITYLPIFGSVSTA